MKFAVIDDGEQDARFDLSPGTSSKIA